jgi:hypothetical protein
MLLHQFYCELEHVLLKIKITSIQELLYHNIFQIHLVGFVIIKNYLRISRCLAKDMSQSNCKKYDEYTIPRTSMTPWVGNLISNSWINFFPTLSNYTQIMLVHKCGKTKSKIFKKIRIERQNGKVLEDYFCICFSPMTQQRKHFLSPISKCWRTIQIWWPLLEKTNVELQNSSWVSTTFGYSHVSTLIMIWRPKICLIWSLKSNHNIFSRHTLITTSRLHTKTSFIFVNLMRACKDSNNVKM